jgi:UDP-N-acetylmuramoyl-L-alanyl-D-glutamate--2,6-diaminopimelate ligase
VTGSLTAVPIPGGPRPEHCPARTLAEVAERVGCPLRAADPAASLAVRGATLSSLTVQPGDLYAALPGARAHGASYASSAAADGAVAVLTDPAGQGLIESLPGGAGLPLLVVADPRARLGDLAAWIYGDPGERLTGFGVTGTNGKTTTTFLLDSALRALGRRTGLIGTIEIRVGDERVLSTGTTPEAPDLHALLAVMLEHGVEVCSMEVSSHALAQHRVDGLRLDVAGFTNLSQDHLDYHHTMEEYFAAKARLFTPRHCRTAVVCVDDNWGRRLRDCSQVPVVTVATRTDAGPADWTVRERTPLPSGLTRVEVDGPAGPLSLHCPLPGEFNIANTLLALAMLVAAGTDPMAAARAIQLAEPVPGRMERVPGPGVPGEPLVVVDFAHTPDAVTAALGALQGQGRPIVVVLGAGGDRDADKRPMMGAAAARAADIVVVTDDNPRSEPPEVIRAAVLAGARAAAQGSGATVLELPGRAPAVAEGVARAWGGGVLLIAGKGHEQGQDIAGVVHPFDDRVVVRAALDAAAALEKESAP